MTTPPAIHLAIIQPSGYVHSLGFLDQARYFRHMFRRLGARVTLAKNRLREDAVNIVFGAHLGFPSDWQQRHACVFVNLEQLGDGGAAVSADYLALLRRSAVVDYDAANVPAYAADPGSVPIVSFGYAAYLDRPTLPLEDRPIDLLFFGSTNPRRNAFIARVEAAGFNVSAFDHAIYGAERDHFIGQAKAVLNCHFYESNRFEQARAFHCLSLGTPVISERTPTTDPSAAFEDSVLWLPEQVEDWFRQHFAKPSFHAEARRALEAFRTPDAAHDPLPAYARMLAFAQRTGQEHASARTTTAVGPWRPRAIHLGAGNDYRPTWLNIDADPQSHADFCADFSGALTLPFEATTQFGSPVLIEAGSVEIIQATHALERGADLRALMGNALDVLRDDGILSITVAHQKSLAAWQDPATRRALNEQSFTAFTTEFWRTGWFAHRFDMAQAQWTDAAGQPAKEADAAGLRIVLKKVSTTPRERTLARTMQADFGGIDDDVVADMPAPPMPMPDARPAVAATTAPSPLAVAPTPTPPQRANPYGLPASLLALLLDA